MALVTPITKRHSGYSGMGCATSSPSIYLQSMANQSDGEVVRKILADGPQEPSIAHSQPRLRLLFLRELWYPFVKSLEELHLNVKYRIERGYSREHLFPMRGRQMVQMVERNKQLTALWYGRGRWNLCVYYDWFIKCMAMTKVVAFAWKDDPVQRSDDQWATLVDSATRGRLGAGMRNRDKLLEETGNLRQQQGESAIDNTLLCNVMTPEDARVLLVGRICRKVFLYFLRLRQRAHLAAVKRHTKIDLEGCSPRVATTVLQSLTSDELRAIGIQEANISWCCLRNKGQLVADWGQIPRVDKASITTFLDARLRRSEGLCDAETDEFAQFIVHAKKHPGNFFKDKKHHLVVLCAGLLLNKIAVIRRSEMEQHTIAKYIAYEWKRRIPLVSWEPGRGLWTVRRTGARETSRIRANECPYADSHGMSVSSSGVLESFSNRAAPGQFPSWLASWKNNPLNGAPFGFQQWLAHELALPMDPEARLGNWYLTDIEKIVQEAKVLNPDAKALQALPEDQLHEVGQNPKIGSSIEQTQHTQISAYSELCQVYALVHSPEEHEEIGGTVDLIQVGSHKDAVLLKLVVDDPTAVDVLVFLSDCRVHMLRGSGGPMNSDFLVKCSFDNTQGKFIVLFVPLAQLDKQGELFSNNSCNLSSSQVQLPCYNIDVGKGVGCLMLPKDSAGWKQGMSEGEASVRGIYDFCRLEGARAMLEKYLEERGIIPTMTPCD